MNHHAPRIPLPIHQITLSNIYPVASACNSRSLPTISITDAWITGLNTDYCIEQGISGEANRLSASQEIPLFLWKPQVYNRVCNSPSPVTVLNTAGWLQFEMERLSVFKRWEQNLMLWFKIQTHRWLLIFLSIALLQFTVSMKCRYFRSNWNNWLHCNKPQHTNTTLQ